MSKITIGEVFNILAKELTVSSFISRANLGGFVTGIGKVSIAQTKPDFYIVHLEELDYYLKILHEENSYSGDEDFIYGFGYQVFPKEVKTIDFE